MGQVDRRPDSYWYRWDLNPKSEAPKHGRTDKFPVLTGNMDAVARTLARLATNTPLLLGYRNAFGGASGWLPPALKG